jgi:hypothetical protein
MGKTASKEIINENINIPINASNANLDASANQVDYTTICLISIFITLVTLAIIYKLKKIFKKEVQKLAITRV